MFQLDFPRAGEVTALSVASPHWPGHCRAHSRCLLYIRMLNEIEHGYCEDGVWMNFFERALIQYIALFSASAKREAVFVPAPPPHPRQREADATVLWPPLRRFREVKGRGRISPSLASKGA